METSKEKKDTVVKDSGTIKGVWQLKYKVTNHNGIAGFGGRMIANYPDPVTGKTRVLRNADGVALPGYYIGKTQEEYMPEKNAGHLALIDWLIGHPEVGVPASHVNMNDSYWKKKLNNPKISLTNLDHQDLSKLDDEEFIDGLVGLIVKDSGVGALGIDKLRFILASLNIMYYDLKHISDPATEKKMLRRKLKNYVRASMPNAKEADGIIQNLDKAKYIYEIKEMIRFGIIAKNNGMYQYQGNPLGISYDSLIAYFKEHNEFYDDVSEKLYEEIKKMK